MRFRSSKLQMHSARSICGRTKGHLLCYRNLNARLPRRGPTCRSVPAFIGRQRDPSKSRPLLRFDLDGDLDKDLGNKASRLVSSLIFSPNGNNMKHSQSRLSRRRARHPVPAGHQGHAQGDAAGGRPAADPARRRRGAPSRHRAFHLRHRAQQGRHRRPFRPPVRAGNDAAGAAEAARRSTCCARTCRIRARRASPASRSRSGLAMRCGARAN